MSVAGNKKRGPRARHKELNLFERADRIKEILKGLPPTATLSERQAALEHVGINVTNQTINTHWRSLGRVVGYGGKGVAIEGESGDGTISTSLVKQVSKFANSIGGFARLKQAVSIIEEARKV